MIVLFLAANWQLKTNNHQYCKPLILLVGSELVDWLVNFHKTTKDYTRSSAVVMGQTLMDCRIFGHVVDDKPFLDGEYFYRFMVL